MRSWGALVAFLYVGILVVISGPLGAALLFSPKDGLNVLSDMSSAYEAYGTKEGWIILAIALIAQAALLSVPVDISARRPVTKRTIIPLVIATAFTTMLLISGALLALEELFKNEYLFSHKMMSAGILLCLWLAWAVLFFRLSKNQDPKNLIERHCRWLFTGSILELLIAVPCHIMVRQRTECCAGLQTGMGIAFGVAVMLFSFGPGVFFLYADRWEHLRKPRTTPARELKTEKQ